MMNSEHSFIFTGFGKQFESGAHLANHLRKPHPPKAELKRLSAVQKTEELSSGFEPTNSRSIHPNDSSKRRNLGSEQLLLRRSSILRCLPTAAREIGTVEVEGEVSVLLVNDIAEHVKVQYLTAESGELLTSPKGSKGSLISGDMDNREHEEPTSLKLNHLQNANGYQYSGVHEHQVDSGSESGQLKDSTCSPQETNSAPLPLSVFDACQQPSNSADSLYDESLLHDVFHFYKYFSDASEEMYENLNTADISFDDLSDACKHLVQFCMQRRMSQNDIRDIYKLQVSMERGYKLSESRSDGYLSSVSHHFKKSDEFVSFVIHERKRIAKGQGWKKGTIVNSIGIKQVGVFLPITRVVQRTIAEGVGLECIRSFKFERNEHGHRTFSCPRDSDIMRVESKKERLISHPTKKRIPKVFFLSIQMKLCSRIQAHKMRQS